MAEEKSKPRPRMYGITPTPMEIPKDRLPQPTARKSSRHWLMTLMILSNLLHCAVYLFLAMVPWSDPDSDLAAILIAHPTVVFGVLPKIIQPSMDSMAMTGVTIHHVLAGLPVIFLLLAIYFGVAAWKLFAMDPWWYFIIRWSMMCNSGYIVVKYLIAISGEFLVSAAPRMISNQTMVYLTVNQA